jgi:hypothetical protein
MINKNFLALALFLIILISGCTGSGPVSVARSNTMISEFMDQNPSAYMKVTYYNEDESSAVIETVKKECANDNVRATKFYLVNVSGNGQNAIAWLDWDNQYLICAFKTGEQAGCTSHAVSACHGDDLYWFDSCGNKEDVKEQCSYGCDSGNCLTPTCTSEAEVRCHEGNVYWFDGCGNPEKEKEHCNQGCLEGACIQTNLGCWDSDNGKNYYVFGITNNYVTEELQDHCNPDGQLVEMFCQEGQVWSEEVDCPHGCVDGKCVKNDTDDIFCIDNDGGLDYFFWGQTEGFEPVVEIIKEHEGELYSLYVLSTSEADLKLLSENIKVKLGGTYNYTISDVYIQAIDFRGLNNTENSITIKTLAVKDHCLDDYVSEYYCKSETQYGTSIYQCPVECFNGVCLRTPSNPA